MTRFDDASIEGMIRAGVDSTYAYIHPDGHLGGVALFVPVIPGKCAYVHIYLWDKLFMARRELHRAGLRDAVRRWDLKRIGTMTPVDNKLAARLSRTVGFQQEGVMRRGIWYNDGEVVDAIYWGLLPEELD